MADQPSDAPEGWGVRQRPAVIAGIATILALMLLLFLAASLYNRDARPRREPITAFPAPGVETFVHDGVKDPHRPARLLPVDPRIAAAKRAVEREGISGWEPRR